MHAIIREQLADARQMARHIRSQLKIAVLMPDVMNAVPELIKDLDSLDAILLFATRLLELANTRNIPSEIDFLARAMCSLGQEEWDSAPVKLTDIWREKAMETLNNLSSLRDVFVVQKSHDARSGQ